jgi:hypothetical protein
LLTIVCKTEKSKQTEFCIFIHKAAQLGGISASKDDVHFFHIFPAVLNASLSNTGKIDFWFPGISGRLTVLKLLFVVICLSNTNAHWKWPAIYQELHKNPFQNRGYNFVGLDYSFSDETKTSKCCFSLCQMIFLWILLASVPNL